MCPSREPPELPIVSIIGKGHLRTDHEYSPVHTKDLAVVAYTVMNNWHSNTTQHIVSQITQQKIFQALPPAHKFPTLRLYAIL